MRLRHKAIFSYVLTGIVAVAILFMARIALAQPTQPPAGSAATSAPAQGAQAGAQPHPPATAHNLLHVKTCDPRLNMMQSGGYVPGPYYGAYAPGWGYRGGYWGDAYGASYYQSPVTTTNPQLGIDYINVTHKTMSQIEFGLVVNGVLRAEVKDVGTFSPNVEIKHKFGLSTNVFPIQSGMPQCIPLRIVYSDGEHWRNPGLPPKNQHIYMNP